jgi:hypothetical protein
MSSVNPAEKKRKKKSVMCSNILDFAKLYQSIHGIHLKKRRHHTIKFGGLLLIRSRSAKKKLRRVKQRVYATKAGKMRIHFRDYPHKLKFTKSGYTKSKSNVSLHQPRLHRLSRNKNGLREKYLLLRSSSSCNGQTKSSKCNDSSSTVNARLSALQSSSNKKRPPITSSCSAAKIRKPINTPSKRVDRAAGRIPSVGGGPTPIGSTHQRPCGQPKRLAGLAAMAHHGARLSGASGSPTAFPAPNHPL